MCWGSYVKAGVSASLLGRPREGAVHRQRSLIMSRLRYQCQVPKVGGRGWLIRTLGVIAMM